jgi:hypothetical protein
VKTQPTITSLQIKSQEANQQQVVVVVRAAGGTVMVVIRVRVSQNMLNIFQKCPKKKKRGKKQISNFFKF